MVLKEHQELFQKIYKKERKGDYLRIKVDLGKLLSCYPPTVSEKKERIFRADLLHLATIVKIYEGKYESAIESATEAVKILDEENEFNKLSLAYSRLSEAFRYRKDYHKAFECNRKAIVILKVIYPQEEFKEISPPYLRELADILLKLNHYEEAEKVLLEAYKMTEETRNDFSRGHLSLTLFNLYLELNNLEKAEHFLNTGEVLLIKEVPPEQYQLQTEIIILIDWGRLYLKKGEKEKGAEKLEEAEKKASGAGFRYLIDKIEKIKGEFKI